LKDGDSGGEKVGAVPGVFSKQLPPYGKINYALPGPPNDLSRLSPDWAADCHSI